MMKDYDDQRSETELFSNGEIKSLRQELTAIRDVMAIGLDGREDP